MPLALRLLFMYSRVFNAWSCPTRGCSLFYFFNQKIGRIKEEQGEVVACCCVPALWLGIHVSQREGVSCRLLQPLSEAGLIYPLPVLQGHQGGLAQPKGVWEDRAVQACRADGPAVCACGRSVLPAMLGIAPASPASMASAVVAERHGVTSSAQPCKLPTFSPFPDKCFI